MKELNEITKQLANEVLRCRILKTILFIEMMQRCPGFWNHTAHLF
jgi:hypothetical protein